MNQHYASDEILSVPGNLQSRGDEITGCKAPPLSNLLFYLRTRIYTLPVSYPFLWLIVNISKIYTKHSTFSGQHTSVMYTHSPSLGLAVVYYVYISW